MLRSLLFLSPRLRALFELTEQATEVLGVGYVAPGIPRACAIYRAGIAAELERRTLARLLERTRIERDDARAEADQLEQELASTGAERWEEADAPRFDRWGRP